MPLYLSVPSAVLGLLVAGWTLFRSVGIPAAQRIATAEVMRPLMPKLAAELPQLLAMAEEWPDHKERLERIEAGIKDIRHEIAKRP